jgi:mRNA interferase MazF
MTRGDLYRVRRLRGDPKDSRVVVVVSRNALFETPYPNVVCAPVHTRHLGLSTEVAVGIEEGLRYPSSIRCDALQSVPKTVLTDYIGSLTLPKLLELKRALRIALEIE